MNIALDDITLVNINTTHHNLAVDVLNFCSKRIKFNKTILFSNNVPSNITPNMQYIHTNITEVKDYNRFVLEDLAGYIDTSHCLIVQNDGFIINPHLWTDEFLNYDFIGAPWSMYQMRVWGRSNRIGNGGFSLRSKKLLQYTQSLDGIDYNIEEDVTVSLLLENNEQFKLPDVGVAVKFSLETQLEDQPYDFTTCFGFHGKHVYNNLLTLCPNVLSIKNS